MKAVIVIIGLLALGALVDSQQQQPDVRIPAPDGPARQCDFDGLNRYLVRGVPDNDDKEANLAYLKKNVDNFQGGIKKAAQTLINLASQTDCNNVAMAALVELKNSGLSFGQVFAGLTMGGQKRIEKLMKDDWPAGMKACEKRIEESFQQADEMVANVFAVVTPRRMQNLYGRNVIAYGSFKHYLSLIKKDKSDEYFYTVYDERTGRPTFKKDFPKMHQTLDKYMTDPCREIVDDSKVLENFMALRLAYSPEVCLDRSSDGKPWVIDFTIERFYDHFAWTRRVCSVLLKMNLDQLAELDNHF